MKDFIILKILDQFRFLFNNLGIDYPTMRKILQIKLIMDERRVPTIMMNDRNIDGGNAFKKSLIMYGVIGLIFLMFLIPSFPLFYKMNIILAMILFLVTTTMIGDYTSVLLDIKEKNILAPKPIEERTINAAKVLHILIYLFTIILAMTAPTLVVGSIKYGLTFGLILVIQLILMTGLIIFSTSLLYFFMLFFFNGEKLKDLINYFQIALTVGMLVLYQLVGRVFQFIDFNVTYTPRWWNYFIPSVWFSAPFSIFLEKSREVHFIYYSILGIVVPTIMLFLYFKAVAPYFEGALQKLNINTEKRSRRIGKGQGKSLAGLFSYDPKERVFFRFTHNMVASERTLKLKLYPSLAFATILPLIFIFSSINTAGSWEIAYQELKGGNFYLFLYFTVSMLGNTVPMLSTSERNKAAWIYHILPIENVNPIYRGSLKAFVVKYILPVYGFVSLIFMGIYGMKILPDVILMFLNLLLLIIIIFHYSKKPLPFSQDFQYIKHNNITTVFQTFVFSGVSAGIHWFFVSRGYNVILYAFGVLVILVYVWKKSFSRKLEELRTDLKVEE